MAPKVKRSWFDTQIAILTISMAAVLGLWNLFAGPDRKVAAQKAAEEFANQQNEIEQQPEPAMISPTPAPQLAPSAVAPQPGEKIILGNTAPQTKVYINKGGGGGGGGRGGGGGATSTSSS